VLAGLEAVKESGQFAVAGWHQMSLYSLASGCHSNPDATERAASG
jgi:hypothetical protein